MMIKEIKLLVKVSRPPSWIVAPLVFLIGLTRGGVGLTYLAGVQIILLTFPFCLIIYGINDVHDYESDKLNPRKGGIEGVKLKPEHHPFVKKAVIAATTLLILSSLFTLNITNIIGMLALLFLAYAYSAPPMRLKEKPPLDSLTNGLGYFFLPFLLGFSFGGPFLSIPLKWYIITICVIGIHAFSTIVDYSVDRKVGYKTFSTVFGKRGAALFALFVTLLTLVFANVGIAAKMFIGFCSLTFLSTLIYPSEKIALLFIKLIAIGFVITAVLVLI